MSAQHTQLRWMAQYNQWMNERLLLLVSELSEEDRSRDRGAFFGSVEGILNHLLFGDRFLLTRVAHLLPDCPEALKDMPRQWEFEPRRTFGDFATFSHTRASMDQRLLNLLDELSPHELEASLQLGDSETVPLWFLLSHLFNHQTHHRGQLTTLLTQMGVEVGSTDLMALRGRLNQ